MALTGRINDWLNSKYSRLPASCTTFHVLDSMEGKDGIEDSWLFTSHGLRNAAGVAVDLSDIRPSGTDNGKGLISSGVVSFARFYSLINEELRRGGVFKNGAITLFLDISHPDLEDYLNAGTLLPWAKRAVYIDDESWRQLPTQLRRLVAAKVNNGEVWLAKKRYDEQGKRLYSNVCLEVLLPHRGTCMLSSVNLGQVQDITKLPEAFMKCMAILCRIHSFTGVGSTGHYLSPSEDRQVGLGVIGLANLLANQGVTYREFVEALEAELEITNFKIKSLNTKAVIIAHYLVKAYAQSAEVAKQHGMSRAFAIAPTASMSYRYEDVYGFTTAPEISPPLFQEVDRDSDTFGVQTYEYPTNVETASEVGWSVQWRLLKAWQTMMNNTGMAHAISANLWTSMVVTEDWITDEFLPSPLVTTYYRLQVDQQALDKSEVVTPESDEKKLRGIYFDPVDPNEEMTGQSLSACNDPNYCEACGG